LRGENSVRARLARPLSERVTGALLAARSKFLNGARNRNSQASASQFACFTMISRGGLRIRPRARGPRILWCADGRGFSALSLLLRRRGPAVYGDPSHPSQRRGLAEIPRGTCWCWSPDVGVDCTMSEVQSASCSYCAQGPCGWSPYPSSRRRFGAACSTPYRRGLFAAQRTQVLGDCSPPVRLSFDSRPGNQAAVATGGEFFMRLPVRAPAAAAVASGGRRQDAELRPDPRTSGH
jgi:hypothetical protein